MGQSSSQMVQPSQPVLRSPLNNSPKHEEFQDKSELPHVNRNMDKPLERAKKKRSSKQQGGESHRSEEAQADRLKERGDRLLGEQVEALIVRLEGKATKLEKRPASQKRTRKLKAIKDDVEQLRSDLDLALAEEELALKDRGPASATQYVQKPDVEYTVRVKSVPESKKRKRKEQARAWEGPTLPVPNDVPESGKRPSKRRKQTGDSALSSGDAPVDIGQPQADVPATEDNAYNPIFTQDNTEHVEAWLASQEPPNGTQIDLGQKQSILPLDGPIPEAKSRKSSKRRRKGDHEYRVRASADILQHEQNGTDAAIDILPRKTRASDAEFPPAVADQPDHALDKVVTTSKTKRKLTKVRKVPQHEDIDMAETEGKLGKEAATTAATTVTGSEQPHNSGPRTLQSKHAVESKPKESRKAVSPQLWATKPRSTTAVKAGSDPDRKKAKPPNTNKKGATTEYWRSNAPTVTSGAFTAVEKDIADHIWEDVSRKHNLSDAEMRAMVKDWRNAGLFKMELEAALPNRTRAQLRKFAQRRWHSYERGPWIAEQDEALRTAHARLGDQWAKISDLVDRSAADCKDRWRKHLQYDDRAIGPWSQQEEDALRSAVAECTAKIKESYPDDKTSVHSQDPLDTMVAWKTVSEKLDGRRSSKQCREKYEKLKMREQKSGKASPRYKSPGEDSRNMQTARKTVENFELGDYYDVLTEIHTSFPTHDVHFADETNVLWSIIAQSNPASRFNVVANGSALRRAAMQRATEQWSQDSKKLCRKLERTRSVPAKALLLAKWVEKCIAGRRPEALPRKFMPELIGKTKDELAEVKRARQVKYGRPTREAMSKDFVVSDSDDEGDDGHEGVAQRQKMQRAKRSARRRLADNDVTAQPFDHGDTVAREASIDEDDEVTKKATGGGAASDKSSMSPERDIVKPEPGEQDEDVIQRDIVEDTDLENSDVTNVTQEVPETQFQPTPGLAETENADEVFATPVVNGRQDVELSSNPTMSRTDFLKKCREVEKRQSLGEVTTSSEGKASRRSRSKRRSVYDL